MEKIKKIARVVFYSFFSLALTAAISTSAASAQSRPGVGRFFLPSVYSANGPDTLEDVISLIIHIAFLAAGLVAVIYLIVGGFRYITASGNPEAVETAKTTIFNSIIGLIVILIAFLIVSYILRALNVSSVFQPDVSSSGGGIWS